MPTVAGKTVSLREAEIHEFMLRCQEHTTTAQDCAIALELRTPIVRDALLHMGELGLLLVLEKARLLDPQQFRLAEHALESARGAKGPFRLPSRRRAFDRQSPTMTYVLKQLRKDPSLSLQELRTRASHDGHKVQERTYARAQKKMQVETSTAGDATGTKPREVHPRVKDRNVEPARAPRDGLAPSPDIDLEAVVRSMQNLDADTRRLRDALVRIAAIIRRTRES